MCKTFDSEIIKECSTCKHKAYCFHYVETKLDCANCAHAHACRYVEGTTFYPCETHEASEAIHGEDRFYVEAPGTDQTTWHVQDHIGNDVFRCESESEARRWIVKHSTEG